MNVLRKMIIIVMKKLTAQILMVDLLVTVKLDGKGMDRAALVRRNIEAGAFSALTEWE